MTETKSKEPTKIVFQDEMTDDGRMKVKRTTNGEGEYGTLPFRFYHLTFTETEKGRETIIEKFRGDWHFDHQILKELQEYTTRKQINITESPREVRSAIEHHFEQTC